MMPSVQSSGSGFSSHMAAKSGWRTSAANPGSALNSSALRPSWPGAFLFLRDLMAAMISLFSGGAVLRSRSASGSCYVCFCWRWWSVQNFTEVFCPSSFFFCYCGKKSPLVVHNWQVCCYPVLACQCLTSWSCPPFLTLLCSLPLLPDFLGFPLMPACLLLSSSSLFGQLQLTELTFFRFNPISRNFFTIQSLKTLWQSY